ncbi:unnamed protein product [Ectocarpus sp. 12 AP-2014]
MVNELGKGLAMFSTSISPGTTTFFPATVTTLATPSGAHLHVVHFDTRGRNRETKMRSAHPPHEQKITVGHMRHNPPLDRFSQLDYYTTKRMPKIVIALPAEKSSFENRSRGCDILCNLRYPSRSPRTQLEKAREAPAEGSHNFSRNVRSEQYCAMCVRMDAYIWTYIPQEST